MGVVAQAFAEPQALGIRKMDVGVIQAELATGITKHRGGCERAQSDQRWRPRDRHAKRRRAAHVSPPFADASASGAAARAATCRLSRRSHHTRPSSPTKLSENNP